MQHATAFSSPQTVPAVPTAAPARSQLWILNSWRDMLLYVGTPLLIVPLFALAQARWTAEDIYLFVAAFGAMGHHLPGMIRAYGDGALFERFKWRFVIAPVFLVAVCVVFFMWDLRGIVLVVFFWGVWHGMMQTYGFCRIYDAKRGAFAAFTRRLDFATCLLWFAAGVFLSTSRMGQTLETYYDCGGIFIAPWVVQALQRGLLAAAVGAAVLTVGNYAWGWSRGKQANPVKLILLATTITFWWYCNNLVVNILVGIALFEVFHDVQYLSLVWIYNRNRVEKDNSIGGFMRFVFRRSGSLVGLYVGLVFAYGSLAYFNSHLGIETMKRALTGVVTASALLHFYYDGFIWKMRESATRSSLGLAGGTATMQGPSRLPGWMLHGLKWAAIFVLPLGALGWWQLHGPVSALQRSEWVARTLPDSPFEHRQFADRLAAVGREEEAAREYLRAIQLRPQEAETHAKLGRVLMAQAKVDGAAAEFAAALALDPSNGETHYDNAYALQRQGRAGEATAEFQQAARLAPKFAPAHASYGSELAKQGRWDEAIAEYHIALQGKTVYPEAHVLLAEALTAKGDFQAAEAEYIEAERLAPQQANVFGSLGELYAQQGKPSQALVQLTEALRLDPANEAAAATLEKIRQSEPRFGALAGPRP